MFSILQRSKDRGIREVKTDQNVNVPQPSPEFSNVYAHPGYADSYSKLDWSGTYFLIRRDLPHILAAHAKPGKALDFGCGTGRSTRLLRELGYDTVGIDVSTAMVEHARQLDPGGNYSVVSNGDYSILGDQRFDVIFACFPFDNIPTESTKVDILSKLLGLVSEDGILVNVVSSPDLYTHEWVSFSTQDFPVNSLAQPGEIVKIVTREFGHEQVCDDVLCDEETYRRLYLESGYSVLACYKPLGLASDGVNWVSEGEIPPWAMWVLRGVT